MSYQNVADNEEIIVDPEVGVLVACCDCGLVHKISVRVDGDKVVLMFKREQRRTLGKRSHVSYKFKEVHGTPPT